MMFLFLPFLLIKALVADPKVSPRNNRIKPIEESLPKKPAQQSSTLWESTPVSEHVISENPGKGYRIDDITEPKTDYHYASFGNPDPFIPPLLAAPTIVQANILKPIVSPLQNFPSSSLKVSGVWETDDGEWKALVMTKDGEGIVARQADPFGDKDGKIVNINEEGLTIREYIKNLDGTREVKEAKFLLSTATPSAAQWGTPGMSGAPGMQSTDAVERFKNPNSENDVNGARPIEFQQPKANL